jgi:DNA-binding FadR family transcriptional regulator
LSEAQQDASGGETAPDRDPAGRSLKRAELVADTIRRRIILGELKEGDSLPPEAQLLASLGISRPTLREALRILEAEQLISVMRGSRSGARVHQPRVESAARYAGFVLQADGTKTREIYEVRLAIEPFMARRLAETRPPGAADRLRVEVARLRAMVDAGAYVDFMIGLAEFHRLLAELSGVQTLLFITEMLQEILARHQVSFFKRHRLPDAMQRQGSLFGLRSFERLIELIDAGNADGAEAHWRLHVTNANASWVPPGDEGRVLDVFE